MPVRSSWWQYRHQTTKFQLIWRRSKVEDDDDDDASYVIMRYQFYNHLQYLPTTICAIINTFIFDSPRPQSCCSSYYSPVVCGSNPKAPHISWSSNLVIPLGQPGYTSLLSHPKSSFIRPSSPHVCPHYLHYISPPAAAKTCRLLFHHTLELLRFVSSFAVRCLSFMAPTSRRLFAVTTPTHTRQRQRQAGSLSVRASQSARTLLSLPSSSPNQ